MVEVATVEVLMEVQVTERLIKVLRRVIYPHTITTTMDLKILSIKMVVMVEAHLLISTVVHQTAIAKAMGTILKVR